MTMHERAIRIFERLDADIMSRPELLMVWGQLPEHVSDDIQDRWVAIIVEELTEQQEDR